MRSNDILEEERKAKAAQEEQLATNSTSEENEGTEERLFTQQEVNRIVAERLARERAKNGPTAEEQEAEKLKQERLDLEFRKYLLDNGFPVDDTMDFFNNIDLSSLEGFDRTLMNLSELMVVFEQQAEKLREYRAAIGKYPIGEMSQARRAKAMDNALKEIFSSGGKTN